MTYEATRWPVWGLIREARRQARLTQQELARGSQTSQAAISRYERARAMPDLATLNRIVEACGFELRLALAPPDVQRAANERVAQQRSVEERILANEEHIAVIHELRRG